MESPARDQLGFVIKAGDALDESVPAQASKGRKLRKKAWSAHLKKYGGDVSKIEKTKALKDLIRREGIPTELRGKAWLAITSANNRTAVMSYRDLLETFNGMESVHSKQIEKDLRRTFPDNAMFESEEGISVLRRVLVAYSWLNPEIGYCQSMNFICALYLLFMDEEDAFWLLKATMEDILPPGYYTMGMLGVRSDVSVLQQLMMQKLPKIAQHLAKLDINLDALVTGWFMCLFVNILPLQATLRVFDSLFLEGSKILFRVGLSLFKCHEKAILGKQSFEEAYDYINHMAESAAIDPAKLLDESFNKDWMGSMPSNKINNMRLLQWQQLQRNLMEETERREGPFPVLSVDDKEAEADESEKKQSKRSSKRNSKRSSKRRISRSSSSGNLRPNAAKLADLKQLNRSDSVANLARDEETQWKSKSRPLGLSCHTIQKPRPQGGLKPVRSPIVMSREAAMSSAKQRVRAVNATESESGSCVSQNSPRNGGGSERGGVSGGGRGRGSTSPSPPSRSVAPPRPPPPRQSPPPLTLKEEEEGVKRRKVQEALIDARFSARLRPFSILFSAGGASKIFTPPPVPPRSMPLQRGPRNRGRGCGSGRLARRVSPNDTLQPQGARSRGGLSPRGSRRSPTTPKQVGAPHRPPRGHAPPPPMPRGRVPVTPPSTQGSNLAKFSGRGGISASARATIRPNKLRSQTLVGTSSAPAPLPLSHLPAPKPPANS